jgi:hypothetical protein
MPHTDRKQIRWQVEDDTIAGAADPATGSFEIGRQRLAIVVGPRGEARQPPVDPILFGLVVKAVECDAQQFYGDIRPRRNRKMAALVPEYDRMGADLVTSRITS